MPLNIWLNIHLKGGEAVGRQVAEVVHQHNRLQQAFLACDAAAAKGAQAVHPGILICNMERQSAAADYVAETIRRKAAFIQFTGKLSTNFPSYVKELKKNGVRINYFGTFPPEQLRSLFELGIEFPLVNDLADAMKAAAAVGISPAQPVFRP
jgi:glycerophosphoryl diester phosphodiesterase